LKELLTLNKYIWRYKWHLILGIGFVFFSNYFRVWQPQVIRDALDLVLEQVKAYKALDAGPEKELLFSEISFQLFKHGAMVLGLALSMGILMYFMRQTVVVMSRLIEYDLRKDIFSHYQKLDTAFYKANKTGDLMSRITEDVSKVRMYLGPGLLYGINLISLFILVISSMFSVSSTLSLYALIPLPILSVSIYLVSDVINKRSEKIQRQLAQLNSIAQEVFSGIRVIKSYVQEKAFSKYFKAESQIYKDKSMDLAKFNALFFPLMIFLIGLSNVLVIYVGSLELAKGNISAGNIAEFIIYVNMLTWPVTAIGWIASIIQQASASQERINDFMKVDPEITNQPSGQQHPVKGHLMFDNVTMTYPDTGIKALDKVSFEILPGENVLILGQTASGKSTLADLILRLYDPTEGSITLDGKPLPEHDLYTLRTSIGYVPQDVFLFSDRIDYNIGFGLDTIESDIIQKAAKNASVHADILEFSNAYQTVVGERGVTLSGGQKQRISIARALVKDPDFIILDDCLSAVDARTEQAIVDHLNAELRDKTSLVITHRIPKGMDFDKVITLDQGKVAEYDSPEVLQKSNGYYAMLWHERSEMDQPTTT
jgi:ATP-binding cassette subfamily B protein